MRCKKHLTDLSSTVGVCASCLRDKLLPLLAVQSPPLIFPRSVSPPRVINPTHHLFFSTPQLGHIGGVHNPCRRREKSKFSLLPNLFRSRSEPPATSSSHSWLSNIFSGRKKNRPPVSTGGGRVFAGRGRGMSPARVSDCGVDEGLGSSSYSSTPQRRETPAGRRGGGGRGLGSQNMTAFCLSPLVRPSPKRQWSQKAAAAAAETQIAATRPHLASAASFHSNRSRKMADFGRFDRRQ